jgi:hypothetical protein
LGFPNRYDKALMHLNPEQEAHRVMTFTYQGYAQVVAVSMALAPSGCWALSIWLDVNPKP